MFAPRAVLLHNGVIFRESGSCSGSLAWPFRRIRRFVNAIETLRVVHFDRCRHVLHVAHYSGHRTEIYVPTREIIADALRFHSEGLLLSHNHPSGDPTPSRSDLAATHYLARAVAALDIRVHDHLVHGARGVVSFRARGWL